LSTEHLQRTGILYALAAFTFWGLTPFYFKAVAQVPPLELLAHRVLWSLPLLALLITLGRQWGAMRRALASRRLWALLFFTAALVTCNWFVFIYAMVSGRILQASLGYYVNPLVNVLLGLIFLQERLRPWQVVAVLLAAAGTLNLALAQGQLPWISLSLAFSFGTYGLLRKTMRIESLNGLFVETCLMTPAALAYVFWLASQGAGAFGAGGAQITLLLALAGMVTALPLVWFTSAARRLPYTTIGLLQYLAPSIQFVLAIFVYDETFTRAHLITFGCIWAGLALYMADLYRGRTAGP
jgi:chloramphenicol-sensitive protein RarD